MNTNNIIKSNKIVYFKEISLQLFTYTLLFSLLSLIIVLGLNSNNISFIYNADAILQHLPTQIFLNNYFFNILRGNISIFNEMNYTLGLGQDILSTFHYYGLTDPINLLLGIRIFYNPAKVYMTLVFIRMYLSGLSFILLCNYMDKNRIYSVFGACVYVFSGYSLTTGIMHPYFINSMILMPLIIISINKLVKENKIIMFILISSLSIIINFYFSFMILISGFIYGVILLISKLKAYGFKYTTKIFFTAIYSFIISVIISAFVLFPTLYGLFTSYRKVGDINEFPFFVDKVLQ